LDELNAHYIAASQPSVLESGDLNDIGMREILIAEMVYRDMDVSWAGPQEEAQRIAASISSVAEGPYNQSNTTRVSSVTKAVRAIEVSIS
jgi:hypothetical protein